MRVESLGDQAWILRDLPIKPAIAARAIELAGLTGVTDVVPCLETVGVYGAAELDAKRISEVVAAATELPFFGKSHRVPVCYELGEDLESVAAAVGLNSIEVIRLHSSVDFECFAIGFCPGFAYLGPLPEAIRGISRMASPRTRTEPGSVGITGNQTAVYPLLRPGGWPIIGKTPLALVDEAEAFFPISVGDTVRFWPISQTEFDALRGTRL